VYCLPANYRTFSRLTTGEKLKFFSANTFPRYTARRIFLYTACDDKVKASTPTGYAGWVPALTLPPQAGCLLYRRAAPQGKRFSLANHFAVTAKTLLK